MFNAESVAIARDARLYSYMREEPTRAPSRLRRSRGLRTSAGAKRERERERERVSARRSEVENRDVPGRT